MWGNNKNMSRDKTIVRNMIKEKSQLHLKSIKKNFIESFESQKENSNKINHDELNHKFSTFNISHEEVVSK